MRDPEAAAERVPLASFEESPAGEGGGSSSPSPADSAPATAAAPSDAWMCSTFAETALTVLVCVVYTLVGPLLIFVNKYLMTKGHFPFPITITCLGQSFSGLFAAILVRGVGVVRHEPVTWDFWLRNVVLCGAATTAALATGNSAYLFLTVSFVEILKGFTPVVTLMVQQVAGQAAPKLPTLLSVLMISVGTAIASYGELHLNWTGVVIMLASVYSEALRLMLTQRMLTHKRFHVLVGLYHLAPTSAFFLAVLAAAVEAPLMNFAKLRAELPGSAPLLVAAFSLAFLVNTSSYLVIKRTNVVMLKLLAISRNAFVVVSSTFLFDETVTLWQVFGYCVTLVFFLSYTYIQFTDVR